MVIPVLLFLLGFALLIKGGDWFVDGAVGIAKKFHLPDLLIGATVVSIGTTLPEVMVSAGSAISGHGEIAYGNAIGSIICNTALIAAITIVVTPQIVNKKSFRMPVIFFFIAAAFYVFNACVFGGFARWAVIVLLCIFIAYMAIQVRQAIKNPKPEAPEINEEKDEDKKEKVHPLWLDIVLLVIGAAMIAVGADLLVDNGTIIAAAMGVPESVIALTFVALGTSLPELVTAITSLVKKHGSLSLGNIIGANFFNLVFVSGLSVTLNPFNLPQGKTLLGYNASLLVDTPVMLGVMLILTIPPLVKGKLSRVQGIVLLILYAGFLVFQFLL